METELVSYFENILIEDDQDRAQAIHDVTTHIPKLISDEQNHMLMRPTTLQEVETAVMQMKENKAPGPNGFTINFFHSCWNLLKFDVWEMVEESCITHKILPSLNATFLTLIPKENKPSTPSKF